MNKQLLLSFISKYNLGGSVESVAWDASGGKLKTRFISDDDSLLGVVEVNTKLGDVDSNGLAVYRTGNLVKLLNVLSDEIDVDLVQKGDKPVALSFADKKTKTKFALAELGIIKKAPKLKYMPETFEVIININNKFSDLFIKAKSAVPSVVSFKLVTTDNEAKLVLGDTEVNTDTITFDVETETVSKITPLLFNADLFKEILSANKNIESTLKVSQEGFGILEFNTDEYKATYYLIANEDDE